MKITLLLFLLLLAPLSVWAQNEFELDSTIVPTSLLAKVDTLIEHTTVKGIGKMQVTLTVAFNDRGQRTFARKTNRWGHSESIYTYNAFGKLECMRVYDGDKLHYLAPNTYNAQGLLVKEIVSSIVHSGDTELIHGISYEYDPNGNIKQQIDTDDMVSYSTVTTFDAQGRKKLLIWNSNMDLYGRTTYQWDNNNQRMIEIAYKKDNTLNEKKQHYYTDGKELYCITNSYRGWGFSRADTVTWKYDKHGRVTEMPGTYNQLMRITYDKLGYPTKRIVCKRDDPSDISVESEYTYVFKK